MRRVIAGFLVVGAVAAAVVQLTATSGPTHGRVDAIFDSAKGLVPGQSVKVAGSTVGRIDAVRLIRSGNGGYRARLQLSVDRRFLPFHADAHCSILPSGLISENYVECAPGTAQSAPLQHGLVPLAHTTVPASLQDVLNVFSAPTSQRVRILLNEFGIATAGRGQDLNAILRRANPALTQVRHVFGILDGQSAKLGDAISQTDRILVNVAAHDSATSAFVRHAATVARTTAAHRGAIADGIHRLPALLNAVDSTLTPVKQLTASGTPLLARLRDAAPALRALPAAIDGFITPARPALRALSRASGAGLTAIAATRRIIPHLAAYARNAPSSINLLEQLTNSMRDRGVAEAAVHFLYGMTVGVASYDGTSHEATAIVDIFPACIVSNSIPGKQVTPGCSHAYSAPGLGKIPPSNVPPQQSPALRRRLADPKTMSSLLDYFLGK